MMRFYRRLKNTVAPLILGGATLQRCENCCVFNGGFSRWGDVAQPKTVFQQPV
jgi:hypothetical protein